MAGYTRQSSGDIVTGNTVEASHFNNEYNQLEAAFDASTGHAHDGSAGNAPKINLTTSVTGVLSVANGGTNSATGDPTFNSVTTDTINESTAAAGVTVDGVLLKDGNVQTSRVTTETSSPALVLSDTVIASTHSQLWQSYETEAYTIQTRDSSGSFVSTDYKLTTSASGGTAHDWRLSGVSKLELTANVLNLKTGRYISGGDPFGYTAELGNTSAGVRIGFSGNNCFFRPASGGIWDVNKDLRWDEARNLWRIVASLRVDGLLETDTINESTAAAGVTVDGALIKDAAVQVDDYKNAAGTETLLSQVAGNIINIGEVGANTMVTFGTPITTVRPSAAGVDLGTTSFPFANAHFDEIVHISKGTAPTTDAGTVLAASQVGEVVSNLKLIYAMDSGTTFDTTVVDGTGTTKGLFKHNQTGGPSANGSWDLFPKDNVISYSWNDVRFSPSAGAFNPDLGSNSLDFKDLYYSGSLNNTSDRNLKEVIVEDASVDIDVEVITGVTLRSILRVVKNTPHSIFTINKDPKKQISFGVIAQNLVAYAALEGITEEQLEEFRFISWHPETEDGPGSYTVDYKEVSNIRDLIRDLEAQGVTL